MADKYDMPVLAKHVAMYLNTVKIEQENVAQCFAWADKFEAVACQRNCKNYMTQVLRQNHLSGW